MTRYILRRIAHIIPTVFGVLLVTFLLFNVVGDSPAVMALGDKTAPKDLEAYERARGYDKPLIFGRWVSTRLFQDSEFDVNPGAWRGVGGAAYEPPRAGQPGRLVIRAGQACEAPLAFDPEPSEDFRWAIRYRLVGGRAELRASGVEGAPRAVPGRCLPHPIRGTMLDTTLDTTLRTMLAPRTSATLLRPRTWSDQKGGGSTHISPRKALTRPPGGLQGALGDAQPSADGALLLGRAPRPSRP